MTGLGLGIERTVLHT